MRLAEHLSLFATGLMNTRAKMIDSIYHRTLKLPLTNQINLPNTVYPLAVKF